MNKVDNQHKELISKILSDGVKKLDRTGVGTLSIFGQRLEYDLCEGFPLLTLRKIHTKSVIHEMLWFLGAYDQEKWGKFGNTNIRYLLDSSVTFWTEWPYQKYLNLRKYRPDLPEFTIKEFEAKILIDDDFAIEFGSIGPGYGKQWINYGGKVNKINEDDGKNITSKLEIIEGINQIDKVIEMLKKDPDSRRIIVDAWKVDELDEMLLPPCHFMFQFYSELMPIDIRYYEYSKYIIENKLKLKPITDDFPQRKLSLMLNIRSQDLYLGNPFNVAEYALLLEMISQVVNMIPHKLIINLGDVHLYNNSIEAAKTLLKRDSYDLPKLQLNKNIKNIYEFRYEDINIIDYNYHPNIKVDVAV